MLNSSQILIGWNWVNKRRDEIEIEFLLVKIFSHTIDSNDTWRERETLISSSNQNHRSDLRSKCDL